MYVYICIRKSVEILLRKIAPETVHNVTSLSLLLVVLRAHVFSVNAPGLGSCTPS